MKKICIPALLLSFVASGCLLVQSFNPFYIPDAVIAMPQDIAGKWYVVQQGERTVEKHDMMTLIFKDNRLEARGDDVRWDFDARFFKAGDRLFMDLILTGKPFKEHHGDLLILTHSAFMVTHQPDAVRLHWLDMKWFEAECNKRGIPLVVYGNEANNPHNYVITADSAAVMQVLTDLKEGSGAFGETWVLKRSRKGM